MSACTILPFITGTDQLLPLLKPTSSIRVSGVCPTILPSITGNEMTVLPIRAAVSVEDLTCQQDLQTYSSPGYTYLPEYEASDLTTRYMCSLTNRKLSEQSTVLYVDLPPAEVTDPPFMADIVNGLPARIARNLGRLYFVADQTNMEYMTLYRTYKNTVRSYKATLSLLDIQLHIAQYLYKSPIPYVDNITALNLYIETVNRNMFIFVADATDDITVATGSALYFYHYDGNHAYKVAELNEHLYNTVVGRPSSTPTDIDDMVTLKHSHVFQIVDHIKQLGSVHVYKDIVLNKPTGWKLTEW